MSSAVRIAAAAALPIARNLYSALKPACQRVMIVGGLRRKAEFVSRIEILAMGRRAEAFVGEGDEYPELEEIVAGMVADDVLLPDVEARARPRWRRFLIRDLSHCRLELFLSDPDRWGCDAAALTGDPVFAKQLFTAGAKGGLLPTGVTYAGGYLARDGVRVPCPTEAALFDELGCSMPAAECRCAAEVLRLQGEQRARCQATETLLAAVAGPVDVRFLGTRMV